MSESVSSSSNKILLDKFLKAVQQKAKNSSNYNPNKTLNPELLLDIENFPQLLNDIIIELKSQKIDISNARIIAATACELLELYTLNHVYQKGEEENLKQVIKLLGFLIVGAIKTPITQHQPSLEKELDLEVESSKDLISENNLDDSPSSSFITTNNLPKSNKKLVISDIDNEEKYSIIALKIVNKMSLENNLDLTTLLRIASFYCVDWNYIQSKRETKSRSFTRLQKVLLSLGFDDSRNSYKKAVKILEQLGVKGILGLAEFQYRKQDYINLKSKLIESHNFLDNFENYSPLELLKNNLLNAYQKLRNSQSSMVFTEDSQLDFDSQEIIYWDYDKVQWGNTEKSLMIFRTLLNVCCDGMYRNYRVKSNLVNGIGLRGKSQENFLEIQNKWIDDLSYITYLSTSPITINNLQGDQLKNRILDWPLSSFFVTNSSKPSEISQTVIKEKVENLSLPDAANLLILLYSNLKKDINSIEQIKSLYNILIDYLSVNTNSLEWLKTHLKQHGLDGMEITEILES